MSSFNNKQECFLDQIWMTGIFNEFNIATIFMRKISQDENISFILRLGTKFFVPYITSYNIS